jgi:hypothetical protein
MDAHECGEGVKPDAHRCSQPRIRHEDQSRCDRGIHQRDNATTAEKLRELNSIRNKCSHNWLLNVPVRRRKKPAAPKPPLLTFRGKDLHNVQVLKGFCAEFGAIYYKLFLKYIS